MWVQPTRTVARKYSVGGLYVCAGGLDILIFDKTSLIYSVSYFNLGGLELCLEGLSSTKSPVAMGLNATFC